MVQMRGDREQAFKSQAEYDAASQHVKRKQHRLARSI